jgi:phosphatidylglycerol---prolipoprotein diacylglyceryl transferase
MYPHGLFGLEALQLLITPIAIFGILFFIFYIRQDGVRTGRTVVLLLLIFVVALLGAKLFSLYVRGWEPYNPWSFELRGGWRYPGAVVAILLLGPLLKRWILPELPLARFLDVLAITVCFAFALERFSCFMNGCCTGIRCTGFFCLSYAPGSQVWYTQLQHGLLSSPSLPSLPVLPLHFLFMAASFSVGLFLMWFDDRRSFNGQIALLFLVLHDGAKGLLESFREPYIPQLQMTSLLTSAAGLVALLIILRWRRGRPDSGRPDSSGHPGEGRPDAGRPDSIGRA